MLFQFPYTVARAMLERQRAAAPVHEWTLPGHEAEVDWRNRYRTVEQVMTRDPFTVQPDTLVALAVSATKWRHVRRVPVEDSEGRPVGRFSSHRALPRRAVRGERDFMDIADRLFEERMRGSDRA